MMRLAVVKGCSLLVHCWALGCMQSYCNLHHVDMGSLVQDFRESPMISTF